jgi:hypothetical protein
VRTKSNAFRLTGKILFRVSDEFAWGTSLLQAGDHGRMVTPAIAMIEKNMAKSCICGYFLRILQTLFEIKNQFDAYDVI